MKSQQQADMLANRVRKRYAHLRKRFARQHIDVFRLYDWDIPEIRAVVDWYAGHLVVAEYTRRQSTPEWLPMMGAAAAEALGVPAGNLHLKERKAGFQEGSRYERLGHTDHKLAVAERDLKFYVNLNDYVDTGLFADHRNTRLMVREAAAGRDFLNLYCYSGSFSCYAARGGARSTVSVDRSDSAMRWTRDNLELNGISPASHELVQSDAFDFLERTRRRKQTFDLAVVDPPSFSKTRSRRGDFDVARDHPMLLQAVRAVMRPGGTIFFSTNHQNFELQADRLTVSEVREITSLTIPEDYVRRQTPIHRCWKMAV